MARNSPYRLLPDGTMKELKEAELSRNLVGVEYGKAAEKQAPKGTAWKVAVAVTVVALGAWLLGLTVVRELQLGKLGREVGALRSDVERMKLQVDRLNQHMEAEKNLLNDLNTYEDGVFAELDSSEVVEDSFPVTSGRTEAAGAAGAAAGGSRPGQAGADKEAQQIDSITADDEDMYDEDNEDGQSGWYQDYDDRNKVHLKGDEFLGKVLTARPNEQLVGKVLNARPSDAPRRASGLNEIRRILQQTKSDAQPPADVVHANAHSSLMADGNGERVRRSISMESPPEEYVDDVEPRSSHRLERKRTEKYETEASLRNLMTQPEPAPLLEPPRHTRNSEDEMSGTPRRAFVAAHFHGNTSHLSVDTHPHYKGNGLVRVAHDAAHSVWWPAVWSRAAPHPAAPVLTRRGVVRVRRTGIYFVYVQIYYLDAHDIAGWVLHRSSSDGEREPLLQCAATSPSSEPRDKPNSCYSAAALLLREGDRLLVRNTGGDRHSLMQPEKSFVGLIKLADADDANDY